jgi:antitoxin VapB
LDNGILDMSLNIKNEEAHRLAKQLSTVTGETLTEAVTQSLRERLLRLNSQQADDLVERLGLIGKSCSEHMKEPFLSRDHGDLLYGPDGLPK